MNETEPLGVGGAYARQNLPLSAIGAENVSATTTNDVAIFHVMDREISRRWSCSACLGNGNAGAASNDLAHYRINPVITEPHRSLRQSNAGCGQQFRAQIEVGSKDNSVIERHDANKIQA